MEERGGWWPPFLLFKLEWVTMKHSLMAVSCLPTDLFTTSFAVGEKVSAADLPLLWVLCGRGSPRAPAPSPSPWLAWTLDSAAFQPWLLHGIHGVLPEKPAPEPPCSEYPVPCLLVTDGSSLCHMSTLRPPVSSRLVCMSSPSKSQSHSCHPSRTQTQHSIPHANTALHPARKHSARPREGANTTLALELGGKFHLVRLLYFSVDFEGRCF